MRLYVGFKGKGNSSNKLVSYIEGEKTFLTNSFTGVKNDIDKIDTCFNEIFMFGLDKSLKGTIRIESCAKIDDVTIFSKMDLNKFKDDLCEVGLNTEICCAPQKSLCNYAYWYMLMRFNKQAVFFHIPSIRYIDDMFIDRIKLTV